MPVDEHTTMFMINLSELALLPKFYALGSFLPPIAIRLYTCRSCLHRANANTVQYCATRERPNAGAHTGRQELVVYVCRPTRMCPRKKASNQAKADTLDQPPTENHVFHEARYSASTATGKKPLIRGTSLVSTLLVGPLL